MNKGIWVVIVAVAFVTGMLVSAPQVFAPPPASQGDTLVADAINALTSVMQNTATQGPQGPTGATGPAGPPGPPGTSEWTEIQNIPAGFADGVDDTLVKSIPIRTFNPVCAAESDQLTLEPTCQSFICAGGIPLKYFTCSGACTASSSETCENPIVGHLVE